MTTFLLDGPLMTAPERRAELLARMPTDLFRFDAMRDRSDAVRTLHHCGYGSFDIHCLVDEAMALAFQEIVVKEMSAS